MDNKRIRKEMAELTEAIGRNEAIAGNKDQPLQQSQLEKLLQDTASLYKKAVLLEYLSSMKEAPAEKQVSEPELIRRSPEVNRFAETVHPVKLEEMPEVTAGINEEQIRLPIDQKPVEVQDKNEEPKTEEKPVAPSITSQKQAEIDLFGDPAPVKKPEVKEKAAPKEDKSLGRKLQKKPITDLKAAIGINEKFQFINELFHGNMTEYNIAINQVNICANHQEAEAYLDTLKELYKWDAESEAVVTFSELVERRFL
jgi:hypothetical protein